MTGQALYPNWHRSRCLVTGAAGFIGSNFVRYVLEHYPEVFVFSLDKLTYAGNLDNLANLPHAERHQFFCEDIGDQAALHTILRQYQIDTIVHFAAESHVDRSISNPSDFIQTNVLGTFNLLDAARAYWLTENQWGPDRCRFHHISTDEVYGSLGPHDAPFSETTPYAPNSPYSASKAGSDHVVRAFFHTYGLPVTTSNCSNNYGPYQHAEKFIPTVIRSCSQNVPIPLYGNGLNVRDWLYVTDHCEALCTILSQGRCGEVYNIGGQCERDNLALAQQICSLMDVYQPQNAPHARLVSFVTDRPGHDQRYAIDNSKIQTELGWTPQHTLQQGLSKTLNFYMSRQK